MGEERGPMRKRVIAIAALSIVLPICPALAGTYVYDSDPVSPERVLQKSNEQEDAHGNSEARRARPDEGSRVIVIKGATKKSVAGELRR